MAVATVENVQSRYHETIDEDLAVIVGTRLGDAELILKSRIPDLLDRVAASEDYEAVVEMVESDMVLRLIRNPDGFSAESDGNYSYQIYQQVASGRLEVLDDEWDLLAPEAGKGMTVIRPWVYDEISYEGAYDPWKGKPPWWDDFYTGLDASSGWDYDQGGSW